MDHVADGNPDVSPDYMQPTEYFDFDQDSVRQFAFASVSGASDAKGKAIKLFYAVRDTIRYDPYSITLEPATYKASSVLAARSGFCLPKANLLIACARATGIAAGIGLADVKNHLCTERLRRMMGGKELFLHHGFAVLHIDGKWVKAAPAFNIELCEKFDVLPTDFDGEHHALFQQFDAKGRRHMEYVADHGVWSDFPFERMAKDFQDYYPASIYDSTARAEIDREIKAEKQAFEDERPLA
jgi:transglutaminase-like putative cysteine protease